MKPDDLKQLRFNIFTNISRMPGIIMNRTYHFADYGICRITQKNEALKPRFLFSLSRNILP